MDEILLTNPINPTELLWFLSRGFDDPVYRVGTNCVYRAFKVDDEKLLVKIIPNTSSVKIEWLYGNRTEETAAFVKNFISEWVDLNTDITPFYDLLKVDDKLSCRGYHKNHGNGFYSSRQPQFLSKKKRALAKLPFP